MLSGPCLFFCLLFAGPWLIILLKLTGELCSPLCFDGGHFRGKVVANGPSSLELAETGLLFSLFLHLVIAGSVFGGLLDIAAAATGAAERRAEIVGAALVDGNKAALFLLSILRIVFCRLLVILILFGLLSVLGLANNTINVYAGVVVSVLGSSGLVIAKTVLLFFHIPIVYLLVRVLGRVGHRA